MIEILYTTSDAIRSMIGLDDDDISDDMLLAQNLDLQMLERLADTVPNHETLFDTDDGERKLKLWGQYFGAFTLLDDSVLAIPAKIQANNDQMSRFQVDFEEVKRGIWGKMLTLEKKLNPPASDTPYALMGISTAGYNPVTGV